MTSQHIDTPLQDIDKAYSTLQERFASRATYSLGYRIYNLKQLAYLIHDNRAAIHEAVKSDLGGGDFVVDISDLYPILNEIDLAVRRLPKWAKDETRYMDSMLAFKFMKSINSLEVFLWYDNIISAWNYPWQLTLNPLVGAIAAGCPAVIKPSELSPASSALMARLIPLYLDPEAYTVVLGGPEQSTHLLKKQWGHVIYTGSDRVGKIVAKAAAETLSPSTLELGGKSPVFVSSCADLKKTARRLFTIKQMTIGQMCVTPDYILCAQGVVDELVSECTKTLDTFFPPSPHPDSLLHSPMTSHLRSRKEYDRQASFLEDAEGKGQVVYRGEADPETNRMGFSLVKLNLDGIGESGGLVEEEIFGPVLPIIPVSSLDKAIEYVNARPHPLSTVVNETTSGSVTWNDFAFATFARSLPFGGVGGSGWGQYHGEDGFKTFSHYKSSLSIPLIFEPLMSLRYPPLTEFSKTLLRLLLVTPLPGRPKSVEDEERRLKWRKWRNLLIVLTLIAVGGVVSGAAVSRR